jgi:hypothetical protein
MPKPKQYPNKITLRLSDEGMAGLKARAKIMNLTDAVAGRVIIEHSVKGEPIKKEVLDGSIQQKK